jgi:hypothetical protein
LLYYNQYSTIQENKDLFDIYSAGGENPLNYKAKREKGADHEENNGRGNAVDENPGHGRRPDL